MIVLSWNCQGLGNPRRVRDLCRLVKEKHPNLVFVMETKLQARRMEFIRIKTGYCSMFVVDSIGRSGGLALFWKKESLVEIKNYSQRHISAEVCVDPNGQVWKFTGFYGNPEPGKRREGWSLLRYLSSQNPQAWLCVGDFNEIVEDSEKFRAALRPRWQMENFNNTLDYCRLQDLGFAGAKFTWCNYREDGCFTQERIDRATATQEWRDFFPLHLVEVLANRSSDHTPLLVSFKKEMQDFRKKRNGFRYEANWSKNEKTKEVVRQAWEKTHQQGNTWGRVKSNIANCQKSLAKWQRVNKDPIDGLIAKKTTEIQMLQEQEGNFNQQTIRGLQEEVNELIKSDDLKWRQRAKEH
jgi:hypothetical protein